MYRTMRLRKTSERFSKEPSQFAFLVELKAQLKGEETLQSAFDGAITARVAVHKNTGASKRFGFVEFNSEESCKAAKADMEDCEIDGSNVTVTYAVSKGEGSAEPPSGPSSGKQSRKHKGKLDFITVNPTKSSV
ncbi:hypothetical protein XENOCAPTIV_001008 [Xenoophorus captivus]|uniref:RRM domain-containing protein n=1 Tax=Xenoophorus captivus TaxID=1517983 RepID=A0ABV0RW68_9TELE